ncbi:hypothetical protein DAKH74_030220 [Maudiozyma humilis]|uniref:Zn(2)-C6 fungal-type domain-containing protein n=1 Tax=Maudiozyma humilis TaxID=51915 RepID=A0AAV5RZ39_MAUHU|nr:hypothetical protein DAKH74_030220 [Kazachstania humilis]
MNTQHTAGATADGATASSPTAHSTTVHSTAAAPHDENPLLGVNAVTAAPNNTPVDTPPASAKTASPGHAAAHTPHTPAAQDPAPSHAPAPQHTPAGGNFAASDGGKFSGGAREGNPAESVPAPHVTTAALPQPATMRSPLHSESWRNAKVKDEEFARRASVHGLGSLPSSAPMIASLSNGAPRGPSPGSTAGSDTFLVSATAAANGSPRLPNINSLARLDEPGDGRPLLGTAGSAGSAASNDLSRYHEQFVTSPVSPPLVSMRRQSRDFVLNSSAGTNGVAPTVDSGLLSADPLTIPANPPKIINSKLDGLRTRLLNNPQQHAAPPAQPHVPQLPVVKQEREDAETLGTAAAVLSNMRSSPFGFGNGTPAGMTLPLPQGLVPQGNTDISINGLRPHSASFSSRGSHSYPRPRIVINKVEGKGARRGSLGSGAIASESDSMGDSSNDSDSYSDGSDNEGGHSRKPGGKHSSVTWNKNGKRVNKFLVDNEKGRVGTFHLSSSDHPENFEHGAKKDKKRKKGSSSASNSAGRQPALSPEALKANISGARHSFRVISDAKKGKHAAGGSRSRTGCWICRLRKKKCTEEKPTCMNCQRLNLTCYYGETRPDFVADPAKKAEKLAEIRMSTREAKRDAMKRRAFGQPPY